MDAGNLFWVGLAMAAIVVAVRQLGRLGERVINETFSATLVCCSDRRPVDMASGAAEKGVPDVDEAGAKTGGTDRNGTGAARGEAQWSTGMPASGHAST